MWLLLPPGFQLLAEDAEHDHVTPAAGLVTRSAENAFLLATADFDLFVMYLAMFSVNLAVVNFLPIPILDGGHMVFLVVEKLRGKPASERALIIANSIGLAIIASLMLFVVFLDVSKWDFVQRWF